MHIWQAHASASTTLGSGWFRNSKSCLVLARSTCSHRPARAPRYFSNCATCRRCQPDHGKLSLHMNGTGQVCVCAHTFTNRATTCPEDSLQFMCWHLLGISFSCFCMQELALSTEGTRILWKQTLCKGDECNPETCMFIVPPVGNVL